ncbi:MAG: MotA/TolQ/ExbB proton channel family protein [Vibrio sp.]
MANQSILLYFQSLLEPLEQFMSQGGIVLWWLAAVVVVCWLLVIERVLFLLCAFPKQRQHWIEQWQQRQDHDSWYALAIRTAWLDRAHRGLTRNLSIIKVLVTLCPMLGLLGTVTGMISVFDVMATLGTNDPKQMASGISLATLPTMAGMVAALSGLFAHSRLVKKCEMTEFKLEKALRSQR